MEELKQGNQLILEHMAIENLKIIKEVREDTPQNLHEDQKTFGTNVLDLCEYLSDCFLIKKNDDPVTVLTLLIASAFLRNPAGLDALMPYIIKHLTQQRV